MSTETSERNVPGLGEVLASPKWQADLRDLLEAADQLVRKAEDDGHLELSDLQRSIVPIDRHRWSVEQH